MEAEQKRSVLSIDPLNKAEESHALLRRNTRQRYLKRMTYEYKHQFNKMVEGGP